MLDKTFLLLTLLLCLILNPIIAVPLLLSPRTQEKPTNQEQPPEPTVAISTVVVNIDAGVKDDNGRYIRGLLKENFTLFDNNVKQDIQYFNTQDVPISIGIIFDISGSVREKIIQEKNALRLFITLSHEQDDIFLVLFNKTAQIRTDIHNPDQIINAIPSNPPAGSTSLYDAVYDGVQEIKRHTKYERRFLLIISDGEENSSEHSWGQLKKALIEGVTIYAICISNLVNTHLAPMEKSHTGEHMLRDITTITGGETFVPHDDEELMSMHLQIAAAMRTRYDIGFVPTSLDGKYHKIKLTVTPPKGLGKLSVKAREGYLAQQH